MRITKAAILVALAFTVSSFSADPCSNPTTSYDRTYCAAKLFLESDAELNQVYKELRAMLKPELQQKLKVVQLEWIKYRDSQCEYQGAINVACNHEVNVARINYLRERLRECKAGQTNAAKIAAKSW